MTNFASSEKMHSSLLAMNSLYNYHMLPLIYQNCSLRQSRCIGTSNQHVQFLLLFVTCYKCFIACNIGSVATGKVETSTERYHFGTTSIVISCED